MLADDAATRALDISLDRIGPGEAVAAMTVRPDMLNGHRTCHGGYIFTLADTAFAFACNSRNRRAVAQQCSVTFLAPAREGDRLTAHATERHLVGRSGVYDVAVSSGAGPIAEFRGLSRTVSGFHRPDLEQA